MNNEKNKQNNNKESNMITTQLNSNHLPNRGMRKNY